ncbi:MULTISPECIES: hypothetical protein [Staphylococcus]|uniref:PepSY domain-containing protein n=1 Tax=Staphylococcus agnetis TaxID=985762 RepID=A0A2T4MJP6_9STAP|nr:MULTISPECIES: hypothetical protein [Staphylococcus]NHM93049.1 hypothetical protein [Staphylococcus sp. 10602379]NJI03530.1 hypothetical protein [Staphylococcus agnetis]NJI14277.1 hypothetical protein [Staphylococcus agnetis]PTH15040.1 hypothetical protein BU591_04300 [Staphylococcus agnetis]PTH29649.1 hypothetical protein BU590_05010 [Staphylococcus agnetis]
MLNRKNWPLLIPIAIGTLLTGSYFYVLHLERDRNQPPHDVLESVKQYFNNVTGSYILYEVVQFHKELDTYSAYKGGITTTRNDVTHHYTFYANAKTGEILDITENQTT